MVKILAPPLRRKMREVVTIGVVPKHFDCYPIIYFVMFYLCAHIAACAPLFQQLALGMTAQ